MLSYVKRNCEIIENEIQELENICVIYKSLLKQQSKSTKTNEAEKLNLNGACGSSEEECAEVIHLKNLLIKAQKTLPRATDSRQLSIGEFVEEAKHEAHESETHLIADQLSRCHLYKCSNIKEDPRSVSYHGDLKPVSHRGNNDSNKSSNALKDSGVIGLISQSKLSALMSIDRRDESRSKSRNKIGYKPAHVTAPFKTSPSGKLKKRHIVSAKHPVSRSNSKPRKGAKSCSSPFKQSYSDQGDKYAICKSKLRNHRRQLSDINVCGECGGDTVTVDSTKRCECSLSGGLVDETSDKFREPSSDDRCHSSEDYFQDIDDDSDSDDRHSLLECDGNTVKLLTKLQRLVKINRRLRSSIRESSTNSLGKDQLDFLELFNNSINIYTLAFNNLYSLLSELRLERLSGLSDTEEICRTRVFLEYILETFQKISSDSFQLLSKNQEILKDFMNVDATSSQAEQNGHLNDPLTLPYVTMKDGDLQYSCESELLKFWDTWHQLEACDIKTQIIKFASRELLPSLKSLPGSDRFMQLHRALYSTLCVDQPSFTVSVPDTVLPETNY